jgi:phage terminase small subunit
MAAKNPQGLTDQQLKFCQVYQTDPELNATKAYQAAYPKCKSEKTAGAAAARLLGNDRIQAYLESQRKKDESESDKRRRLVLESLQLMVDVGLEVKESKDANGNVISRKFNDVNAGSKGVELLGKHEKMFTDKVEHSGEMKLTGVLKMDFKVPTLEEWIKGTGGTVEKET